MWGHKDASGMWGDKPGIQDAGIGDVGHKTGDQKDELGM